jgi:hypothetical protein
MPPGITRLAALEYDVIDRTLGEQPADGQPGMAGADDNRGVAFDDRPLRRVREPSR